MNYRHFTIEERCCLREYYIKGKSYREIARLLGRNASSVSRELRRNCTFFRDVPRYYPYTAQKKSDLRNSYRHRGMFWPQEVLDYIDEKLSRTWSPEQIANTPCGMKMPSFKTIYRWIDERYLRSTQKICAGREKRASVWVTEDDLRRGKVYAREIKVYITAKSSDIGKQIQWYRGKEKVKYVLHHSRRERRDIISQLRYRTEKGKLWLRQS